MMRGDFDLNSMQEYTGPCDVFRKTMLNQDLLFRNQVHELHQLYRTQKTLMQNPDRKEYHTNNFSNASAQSTLSHCTKSIRHEPRDLLEGCKVMYDTIQPRSRDVKLALDPCSRHTDPAELKLSLNIREDNRREQYTSNTRFDVGSHSSSPIVIDLEESERSLFFSTAAPIANLRGKDGSEAGSIISSSENKNNTWNPSNQGPKRSGGMSVNNSSTVKQQFNSYEAGLLDLNKTQLDDSFCLSNDPTVAQPSTAISLHAFLGLAGKIEVETVDFATEKRERNNCSEDTSEICHAGNFSFLSSNRKNEKTGYLGMSLKVDGFRASEMHRVSSEAVSGCNSKEPKNGSDEFIQKLLNSRSHSYTASKKVYTVDNRVEDPAISYSDHNRKTDQDGLENLSSSSSKPHCIAYNDSSNAKTMEYEVPFRNSNPFSLDQLSGTHEGSQETLMVEQDQRSSDSSEFKQKCLNKEKESDDIDALTREVAEALLGFSLDTPPSYQDCAGKERTSNMVEKDSEKPHSTSDFFELMTLTLTESSVDDYCVSSNPSDANFTENKDLGLKFRRGRRLKDFQKDVLPGLASLSRHEIREDINIMEGVLKSREYKRLRAKMADGHGWCIPVKNKRSRRKKSL